MISLDSNTILPVTILVPQGAEYKAVCRGLSGVTNSQTRIIPIPMGNKSLCTYLHKLQEENQLLHHPHSRVLLMGLCGSLSPSYSVGDIVLYENCLYQGNLQPCDRTSTTDIAAILSQKQISYKISLVKSLTSDRLVWLAAEKRHLGTTSGADVVDMEGFAALEFFSSLGVPVAMLRVVSDDCHHDIPDLTSAISADGALQPLPLAMGFIRHPVAAIRLIRGSLQGLKVLQHLTKSLFSG